MTTTTTTDEHHEKARQDRCHDFEKALCGIAEATTWYLREVGFAIDTEERYVRFDDIADGVYDERLDMLTSITEELLKAAQRTACGRGTCGREHAGCFNPRPWDSGSPAPSAR